MVRRHKLPSEASKRFERGVDPELPPAASARAVQLLAELGGASHVGSAEVDHPRRSTRHIPLDPARPGRTAGLPIAADVVARNLTRVGCTVETVGCRGDRADQPWTVTPPTWRPDLTDPTDLVEEVIRLEGYEHDPRRRCRTRRPAPGYAERQRLRRRVGRALAAAGYVEVLDYPFVGEAELDALGLPADDDRRRALRLANPLSDDEPLLRTTLLPGLLAALRRNVGRGIATSRCSRSGLVFRPGPDGLPTAPRLPVDRRPTDEEIAALDAALPAQPRRVAVVLAGDREPAGWWGAGRAASLGRRGRGGPGGRRARPGSS